jgi:hypothetical protein
MPPLAARAPYVACGIYNYGSLRIIAVVACREQVQYVLVPCGA